jgi:hypothetical protein
MHAGGGQSFTHVIELEWLDDGCKHFHVTSP